MALSDTRINDLAHFLDVAVEEKWDEGTDLTRYQMAQKCGWNEQRLAAVVRAVKEYPEYGLSISTRRGPEPHTVVSFSGTKLASDVSEVVAVISNAKAKENFLRLVRDACSSFVAYKNSNKATTGGRKMKPYNERTKAFLQTLRAQAVSDNDVYGIKEMVERALVVAGVHYTDEDEDGAS